MQGAQEPALAPALFDSEGIVEEMLTLVDEMVQGMIAEAEPQAWVQVNQLNVVPARGPVAAEVPEPEHADGIESRHPAGIEHDHTGGWVERRVTANRRDGGAVEEVGQEAMQRDV